MDFSQSQQYFKEASESLVGGVNSPVRAFKAVGGQPLFVKKGQGAHLFCQDGHRYIDYVLSFGPLLLGHAHPDILNALHHTMEGGTTFGAPTVLETELALRIKSAYPYVDKVRFVSSGTEAAMSAIRLARGVTKRSKIVKFNGCYHGHADSLLVHAGSGAATLGVPDSAGVLGDSVSNTIVLEYNDPDAVKECFKQYGSEIACVLLEPVSGNMGVIIPDEAFVQTCRTVCNEYDALLVFDEVMCGFRTQPTGTHEWIGVNPDIVILGKVIGGGLPCGAYAARGDIMAYVAPEGPVYQAGTLSGNPLAMAAGIAMLDALKDGSVFHKASRYTETLVSELQSLFKKQQIDIVIQYKGTMFTIFYTGQEVRSFADVQSCNQEQFKYVFHNCLKGGLFFPPSQYEACFTSNQHAEKDLKQTVEIFSCLNLKV